MRISPDPLFAIWRADEAAECLELPEPVYTFLWNEIVPLQDSKYDQFGEARFEEPVFENICNRNGHDALKKYWNKLPEEYKRQLNRAARSQR